MLGWWGATHISSPHNLQIGLFFGIPPGGAPSLRAWRRMPGSCAPRLGRAPRTSLRARALRYPFPVLLWSFRVLAECHSSPIPADMEPINIMLVASRWFPCCRLRLRWRRPRECRPRASGIPRSKRVADGLDAPNSMASSFTDWVALLVTEQRTAGFASSWWPEPARRVPVYTGGPDPFTKATSKGCRGSRSIRAWPDTSLVYLYYDRVGGFAGSQRLTALVGSRRSIGTNLSLSNPGVLITTTFSTRAWAQPGWLPAVRSDGQLYVSTGEDEKSARPCRV